MPTRNIDSTVKVYTREVSSNAWVLNEKLTCLSVTDAYGLMQPHTAQLKLKTPDMSNDLTDPDVISAQKAMRYNADVELQISKESVFYQGIVGLWCQVTTAESGDEITIFVGQIVGNNLGFKNLMCDGVIALGIDFCLSHQGPVGSLCYDPASAVVHYDSVPTYFNPKGRPNMGALSGGVNPFDYSLIKDINVEANYWAPSTIIKYLLYQLNNQVVDAYPSEKRYEWFATLTNTQLSLDNDSNVFTEEQKSADYKITDQSLWATMVQLVEVNGLYTLGIKYDSTTAADPKVRLEVLELV